MLRTFRRQVCQVLQDILNRDLKPLDFLFRHASQLTERWIFASEF